MEIFVRNTGRGCNLLLAVYGGLVFSLLFFFPHEGKEKIEKELQSLGSTSFLKKSSFCSRVISTPTLSDFGRNNDVNCVRENCDNWKGDRKHSGSGSVLV